MEVTPISGTVTVLPVAPVKRVAQVRKGEKSARKDETEEPERAHPDPGDGNGQLLDLYV
jgi:hypothetical protein